MAKSKIIKLNGHDVKLTNLDKILFPKTKITKEQLIDYYLNISEYMLYLIEDHPITMFRFPDGIDKEGFFQKDASDYFPKWIKTVAVEKKEDGYTNYVICNNKATLTYLANQVCTPHIWLSEYTKPHNPDRLTFDLDPSTNDFSLVKKAALEIKEILEDQNLKPFIMTTGSKGIHITTPLDKSANFDQVKEFSTECAKILVKSSPNDYTLELRKNKRGDRVFIDTLRNRFTATAVAPYAIRPKESAPVACPIYWEEVKEPKLQSQSYNINNVFDKLKTDGNPWEDFYKYAKALPKK